MSHVDTFIQRLRSDPTNIQFADTIAAIESAYIYAPTAFRNGEVQNAAGQNAGSCKIFAFAQLQGLSVEETLACFGHYYRVDVLQHPDGEDHSNIRQFLRAGWSGIQFEGVALTAR